MTEKQELKTMLSLHEAAQLLTSERVSVRDAEVILVHAIEHAELHADIKRWVTEQWDSKDLAGNINSRRTFIERADLETWQKGKTAPEGVRQSDSESTGTPKKQPSIVKLHQHLPCGTRLDA